MKTALLIAVASAFAASLTRSIAAEKVDVEADRTYLTWTAARAQQVGRSTRVNGRVGGVFDFRVAHTEHAYNYKLRATWLTPDVIRATARLVQLSERLTDEQTETLVMEAEQAGDTVILVEIDPREGSGVIPNDWTALLQRKELQPGEPGAVKGRSAPQLRKVRSLSGVFRRDYNYDVFWMVFPLVTDAGQPLFSETTAEAELLVQIYNKAGRVTWPVPASVRARGPGTWDQSSAAVTQHRGSVQSLQR